MQCAHFDAGCCRSCVLMGTPYAAQLNTKQRQVEVLLGTEALWSPPASSAEAGFRNKAKMAVAGTVEDPQLGILAADGTGTDLRDCGLHVPAIREALPLLAAFVTRARLTPYDVGARRGELKHLLVTASPTGQLMVRFVLRSREALPRVRKHLPELQSWIPALAVVSVNLLPQHKAATEGDEEVVLTDQDTLPMRVGDLELHLRPQGFFQTNTQVAQELYRQARTWVDDVAPATLWDLYCGVGGFALHCAAPGRVVTGVEVSAEAVAAGRRSAEQARLTDVTFLAGDATAFALAATSPPDLVVVNPPRRGLGAPLAGWLEGSGVPAVLYSSCNPVTLARDLAAMPSLAPRRARLLDMFPQTDHGEVLVLLERIRL